MSESKKYAIGVDIGGTHIISGAIDSSNKSMINHSIIRMELDNRAPADEIINIWSQCIADCIQKAGDGELQGIGFAMPGPFDYAAGIALFDNSNDKYMHLNNLNIGEILKSRLGLSENIPLRFINDATAFAIGEDYLGAGASYQRSLSITLGTGFGSAFLKNGLPIVAGNSVPKDGCVWHLPYKDSIADDYFTTKWFTRIYEEKTHTKIEGAKYIFDHYHEDDICHDIVDEFSQELALFLLPIIQQFDAETLIIGGNISNALPIFQDKIEAIFESYHCKTSILPSTFKEEAAIIGASKLSNNDYWKELYALIKNTKN